MKAPSRDASRWEELVESARTLYCIHCGLCLDTCPTYELTGRESASPRGRVHLMRAAGEGRLVPDADFAAEMNGCLVCRRCESVCPAGVEFGPMMGQTRAALQALQPSSTGTRFWRWFGFRVLLSRRWALRATAALVRLGQVTGLDRLSAPLLPRGFPAPADAPVIPPARERSRLVPARLAAPTEQAFVLEGCVMPILFGAENRATVAALAAHGVQAIAPPSVACCGSLAAHNGDAAGATELAKRLIEAYAGDAPIVVNSAGCTSHMHELDELFERDDPWHARAKAFSERVVDFTTYLSTRVRPQADAHVALFQGVTRVTYDDPCHLCHGMGVRQAPRDLLDAAIASENERRRAAGTAPIQRVELDESEACCGAAGLYSMLHPAESKKLLESKLDAFEATGAELLITANPGCQMQWRAGLSARGHDANVAHIATLMAEATARSR